MTPTETDWDNNLSIPHLSRLLSLRTGVTGADLQDLTQETLLRGWKYKAQHDPSRGSLVQWLSKIGENVRRDWIRKSNSLKRGAETHSLDPETLPYTVPPREFGPDVRRAWRSLSKGQKQAVSNLLRGDEIGSSKTALHWARKRLRENLKCQSWGRIVILPRD